MARRGSGSSNIVPLSECEFFIQRACILEAATVDARCDKLFTLCSRGCENAVLRSNIKKLGALTP